MKMERKNLGALTHYFQEGFDLNEWEKKKPSIIKILKLLESNIEKKSREKEESISKIFDYLAHAMDLLTIHRNDLAGFAKNTNEFQLILAVNEAISLLPRRLVRGINRVEVHVDTKVVVTFDRSRFLQVLVNVLKNAAEAVEEIAHPYLKIESTQTQDTEYPCCLKITDNGCGINPQDLPQIFQKGFSTKCRSSGIGLYGAKKILESMRARIEIASDGPGRGTTVLIYIPCEVVRYA